MITGNLVLMTADLLHPKVGRALGLDGLYPIYRENYAHDKEYFAAFPNLRAGGRLNYYAAASYNVGGVGNGDGPRPGVHAPGANATSDDGASPSAILPAAARSTQTANYAYYVTGLADSRSVSSGSHVSEVRRDVAGTVANQGKALSQNWTYDYLMRCAVGEENAHLGADFYTVARGSDGSLFGAERTVAVAAVGPSALP